MMEVIARQLRLVTLITVGWCLQAQAQPTDFSLPPLPDFSGSNANGQTGSVAPIPASPVAPNAGAQKTTAMPEATDAPVAIPELANLPTPAPPALGATEIPASPTVATATATEPASTAPALPEAPALPPVMAESSDRVADDATGPIASTAPAPLSVGAPPATLPGLSLPLPPSSVGAAPASAPATASTTLPEVDVEGPAKFKMGGRTWNTTLAPSYQPKTTSFNYRRQVLPDAIYRKQYDRDNNHLPRQVTRDDYTRILIERVAKNDINGTRALLNEGLSVNTTDSAGQTLLAVARRFGARDTERLLIARGAS